MIVRHGVVNDNGDDKDKGIDEECNDEDNSIEGMTKNVEASFHWRHVLLPGLPLRLVDTEHCCRSTHHKERLYS